MVCSHCNEPIREIDLFGTTDWIHADGRSDHVPDPKDPPATTIFTMRVELPLDANRTGIRRMVCAAAEIITHMGVAGISADQRQYLRDPDNTEATVGEWALGPDPEPNGTATYAFNARELATMLHALRIVEEIRDTAKDEQSPITLQACYHHEVNGTSLGNNCDHFGDFRPLDNAEIDALCDRLNPLDALMR